MNNIIKFEKEERRENKWGIGLALGGILFAFLFGIALPIYWTPLSFNGVILSGVILMFLGILYMIIAARIERINLNNMGENSYAYLLGVKEKLKNSGSRKGFHGIAYVAFIVSGILCIYWGISTQMDNGENLFSKSIWMPVLLGMLGWMWWRIRYSYKEKTKIQPILKEIDNMLEGIE